MDDVVPVEVVDSIKDGADNNNRIVLGKLALCEDAVKELSAGGKFEGEVIFCA